MEQKFQISLVCDQQVSSYWSSLVATPQILKSKSNWKSISGVPPSCCRCCPNSPLDRVNQSIDSSTYVPGSEADQRMDDELEDQSHAIDFQLSSEKFVDYAYLLY